MMLQTMDLLQTNNQKRIRDYLHANGPQCRDEIVAALNMPRTTVFENLYDLRKFGIVDMLKIQKKAKGRPKILFYEVDHENR